MNDLIAEILELHHQGNDPEMIAHLTQTRLTEVESVLETHLALEVE